MLVIDLIYIYFFKNDKTNNDCGTSYGNVHDDLLSSINNDHCYTAIRPQENKIVDDTVTINYPKRDAPLFSTELTSPIPKRLKVLYLHIIKLNNDLISIIINIVIVFLFLIKR